MESALNAKCGDETVNELIVNATAKIGEKMMMKYSEHTYIWVEEFHH